MSRPPKSQSAFRFIVAEEQPEVHAPAFWLCPGDWDDYSYRTQFDLAFLSPSQERPVALGAVKILPREIGEDHRGWRQTVEHLPRTFTHLEAADYCSLGQSSQYYSDLRDLQHEGIVGRKVAEALADICLRRSEKEWWSNAEGIRKSLRRTASARIAQRDGAQMLDGHVPEEHVQNEIPILDVVKFGRIVPEAYALRFDGGLPIPGRLNVLVGKNGSGKTTLLEDLARRLAEPGGGGWEDHVPQFSRIVLVATNSFDSRFDDGTFSSGRHRFEFVGRRPGDRDLAEAATAAATDPRGTEGWAERLAKAFPTPAHLLRVLPPSQNELNDQLNALRARKDWVDFARDTFEDEALGVKLVESPKAALEMMSAGQKALVTIYAGLFSKLDKKSLVLIDEPENYLHPSLVARFVRHLNDLLQRTSAFAVVVTHSPIVLQETAGRFVTVIDRDKQTLFLSRPSFETFGESLENINEYLFDTDFSSSHWKGVLRRFAQAGTSDDQICAMLETPELPLLARTFLARYRAEINPKK